MGITPGSVNWCQNIEDDSNCHNIVFKHLSNIIKFLHSGTFDARVVEQNKEPLIAIFNLLGFIPDSVNRYQNIGSHQNCPNCNVHIHKMKKRPVKTHRKELCVKNLATNEKMEELTTFHHYTEYEASKSNESYYAHLNTGDIRNQENNKYDQNPIAEAYLSIVVQITEEINSFINQNRAAPTELQRLLEAKATYNQTS